jgi:glucose-6-phosphate isomerase/CheY-like chemotaxis protein
MTLNANIGSYQAAVDGALAEMARERVLSRLWAHDHTIWKPEPTEITNRLGWLHSAEAMMENVPRLEALAADAREAGYTHALLLGMGGSSLAPQVLRKTFGVKEGSLDLAVLDSTDPGAVLDYAYRLDPARTLFIVATKSGTTAETLSFFKFFYNWVADALEDPSASLRAGKAGEHFVAITDPGSKLVDTAQKHNFRATFLNDPNIGGRYSALSYFGLVPAALVGVDVPRLLDCAAVMASGCGPHVATEKNPAARLGTILGKLAEAGRDKVTFAISPTIASFGDWVEQLIAESIGKEGKGILPVVGEPLGTVAAYGFDRLFVHLRLEGDETHDVALSVLEAGRQPVVRLHLRDLYNLGGQMFLWELATAVAGYHLGINPFDQPNVESAKVQARRMIAEYKEKGTLPALAPALTGDGMTVYGGVQLTVPDEPLVVPLGRLQAGQKVVAIEDEPEMIGLLTRILEQKGFELVGAVGGRRGLETIRREKPDLVLLDLMMPDMDGWEIYQQMKSDEELKDIPVIVVTAKARSIDKVFGLHIAEPVRAPGGFLDRIKWLMGSASTKAGPQREIAVRSPGEALIAFLSQGQLGDYIALQAYVQPTPETDTALADLRKRLRDRFRLATTVGYGPRFLHSTGQLHKGDAGHGLFVQFTADPSENAPIPDEAGAPESSLTFGVLIAAQALGDRQALLDNGRRVIRFHLGNDVVGGLRRLLEAVV